MQPARRSTFALCLTISLAAFWTLCAAQASEEELILQQERQKQIQADTDSMVRRLGTMLRVLEYYQVDKAGERTAIPSDLVNKIVLEESAKLGLVRRKIGDEEIVQRALYSLINEGARILEEGIAQRASDIDVVYLTGYGFPDFRGGPLFYADSVGLSNILRSMREFAKGYQPDAWEPAPLLKRLAAEGKTFAGWGAEV
jgi:hypothetical protein